ncbi:hypothetical protein [Kitasatospora aureofaciens]|uniref:hypothetical protein n=1 Tax=Kitasatospora aureofaciens TaxID=1894 RepID=UPI0033E3A70F
MHPTGPIAQRFPLVARIRPACLPLDARVGQLSELADTAARQTAPGPASTVFNQAALLASDVGLPDYARELCHRHAALYLTRGPLPAMSAIRGLEPLVNLARLNLRASQHQQGHQLLLDLYQAITSATETVLDGITVPAQLTETDEQRAEVRAWLWRVVIADGTRALTCTGRWSDALRHLEEHRGVGLRMLDGRQTAVLAAATTGDLPRALALLSGTEPGNPWENAVTAVLTALCCPGDQHAAEAAIDRWLALAAGDGLAVFTTRLGLTAFDTTGPDTPATWKVARQLTSQTIECGDGYAARDVLDHPAVAATMFPAERHQLTGTVTACGLDQGDLPADLQSDFATALDRAASALTRSLAASR